MSEHDIQRLTVLLEILTECSRLTSLDALPSVIGMRLPWVIDFRRCVLVLGEDTGSPPLFMAVKTAGPYLMASTEFSDGELEIVWRVLANRRIEVESKDAPSGICAPLESSGRLLGALWLSAPSGMTYTLRDSRIVLFVADFIAGTLARIQQADTIVRLRQIEAELRETQQMLMEALRTRDEFLSIASHELKTPLTALKLQN